jgi:NADH dehydrogenase/NADH:ubiquinone oxidoreductase subunit G
MKVEVRIKKMNIISPFNSETLDTDELEEAERRVQDLRIMLIKQTAEARVAASSLDDKAAVERIASNEKQAKADLQFLAEVLAILVMIAESYDNRGLHKMRAESLRDRADFLLNLALKRSGTGQLTPFAGVEHRKSS